MARPSGQNTMKPITISAMVAGVQAGRISAVVFISLPFLRLEAANFDCSNRNGGTKQAIQGGVRQNRTSHGNHYRFLKDSRARTANPASSPQKAEPMPRRVRPDAVTANAVVAAMRSASSL